MGQLSDSIMTRALEYIQEQALIFDRTISDIAKDMGLSPGEVTLWQEKKRTPTIRSLEKLINWGMDEEYLLTGKTSIKKKNFNSHGPCFALGTNKQCVALSFDHCIGAERCHFYKTQEQIDYEERILRLRAVNKSRQGE